MLPELDFRNTSFRHDPHAGFTRARAHHAVAQAKGLNAYVITKHAECESLLKDPRIVLDQFSGNEFDTDHPMKNYFRMREGLMLFANAPRHYDLRTPAKDAMSARSIRRYEGVVRESACDAISVMEQALNKCGEVDFVREISIPFVSSVICKVVGMPEQDHTLLARMTQKVADGLDPFGSDHDLTEAGKGYIQFRDYMTVQLEQGRWKQTANEFADSFMGDIAECPHMLGAFKNRADLISTMVMLLSAGHLTTNHSLSLSVKSLLLEEEYKPILRERIGAVTPQIVEELFRYHCPAQITRRRAQEEVNVAGIRIAANQALWLALVSANRDEEVFTNAQSLDFTRKKNPHLAFGGGEHFCLGVHLARLQLRIFLEELQGRFPKLRVKESIPDNNLVFRGLKKLVLV